MGRYDTLNDKQKQAVMQTEGPVLVLAGAGSGKTRVLTHRVAYLIDQEGVNPYQIMAITFTNKAAGELKQRLEETLGEAAQEIQASTFHSACVRILRSCIDRIGYDNRFTIYDTDDCLRLIKDCMQDMDVSDKKFQPKSILGAISSAKEKMLSPEEYAAEAGNDYWKTVAARIYQTYQNRMQAAGAVDFDDLICLTVRIFENCPDVLEKYRRRYRYLMVDEYQDTNYAQYRLVSLLAGGHSNLCVVGDDDQSIYRFRGATVENILQFEEQFPQCRTIRLEENYRSTQHILDAANGVISRNKKRKEKRLWTAAGEGEPVVFRRLADEKREAQFIADNIEKGVKEGRSYSDFAVLYRMNALSNALERSFLRCQIPYRVFGGVRFQDRKEIRDIIAYLCLLQNPGDIIRFERIVNVPKRQIGESTVELILRIAEDLHMTPLDVMRSAEEFPVLAKRTVHLKRFADMMDELTQLLETEPLDAVFDALLEKSGYEDMLLLQGDEGKERLENVRELRSNIAEYMQDSADPTLEGFLEENALYTDADRAGDADCVSLMTMHAAKGLEFDTVFAVGMEQGIFPGTMRMESEEDMEEERRLAYVTITRAKRHLYLTCAAVRMLFGHTRSDSVSMFVQEIPQGLLDAGEELIQRTDISRKNAEIGCSAGVAYMQKQMQKKAAAAAGCTDFTVFDVGDRICSQRFGAGTILSIECMGGDAMMEVAFDQCGTKKIMAKYQKIEKI